MSRLPDQEASAHAHPTTPDGRYFVVRGRLWRCSNPGLSDVERANLVRDLMRARAAVGRAKRAGDADAERTARASVHAAKVALGERGAPWWADGSDYNRVLVKNSPYASWFEALPSPHDSGGAIG